ncbi:MAG: hypothetical protein JWM80_6531, partial [Cyanobacteria bacterium RYN_339]|nr:hypothetical protein [Cyanobacteria bacterium RYN_339]
MGIENKAAGKPTGPSALPAHGLEELRRQAAIEQAAQLEAFAQKAHAEAQAKAAGDRATVGGEAASPEQSAITGPTGDQAITPAPADLPPVLDAGHASLADQPQEVKNAIGRLTSLTDGLAGTPAERVKAISLALVSDPPIQQQLEVLKSLPPEFRQLADEEIAALNQAATPQELAKVLEKQADFKDLDPLTVFRLATMVPTTQDPALRHELGALGAEAMTAGFITAANIEANPELGQFLLLNKDSSDDQQRGLVQETFRAITNQLVDRQIGAGNKFSLDNQLPEENVLQDRETILARAGIDDAILPAFEDVLEQRSMPTSDINAFDIADEGANVTGDITGTLAQGAAVVVDVGSNAVADGTEAAAHTTADLLEDVGQEGLAADVREKADGFTDTVRDTASKVVSGLEVGGAFLKDGVSGGMEELANKLLGDESKEFGGQVDGFTGLITNRLDRGESVFMNATITAEVSEGAEIGFEVNGKGGKAEAGEKAKVSLTGGATLGRNPDGTLSLVLEVGGKAGVEETAGAQVDLGAAKASVEAEAGLSAEGKGKMTFTFDPTKLEDVALLKQFTEPQNILTSGDPVGALVITGQAIQDAMATHLTSTEFGGQMGADVGVKAKVSVGSITAKAGIEANAALGEKIKNNRDGSQEITVFVRGGVSASASVGEKHTGLEAGATVGANGAL